MKTIESRVDCSYSHLSDKEEEGKRRRKRRDNLKIKFYKWKDKQKKRSNNCTDVSSSAFDCETVACRPFMTVVTILYHLIDFFFFSIDKIVNFID